MKILIILLYCLNTTMLFCQFDSLVFLKDGVYLSQDLKEIYALGDQNNDGYDDIMIYDCLLKQALIFFGESPMDTIVDVAIPINLVHSIITIDLNDDGKDEIVLAEESNLSRDITMKVYWGGAQLDSIPDIIFSSPEIGFGLFKVNDFNGDGRNEFVYWGYFERANGRQYGRYYFYNTESKFDTVPHYTISGDSINYVRLAGFQSGDINGDGMADLMIYGTIGYNPPYDEIFLKFFLGNTNWDLTEDQVIYKSKQSFDITSMHLIEDINGDKRDDLIIKAYGNVYPYYWYNSILYGSFPIDTLQDVGLNTQNEALNLGSDARIGDVNGDGYNDLLIQTYAGYPDIKLWLGSSTMYELPVKEWEGLSSGFGRLIAATGDVNGDGADDIAIAEIPFSSATGKVYIYMGDTSVVNKVKYEGIVTPKSFKFFEPYPNPFNPSTKIKYSIPQIVKVQIKILDILGKEVVTLVDEEQSAGTYEVKWNAEKLPSGIYFSQIKAGNFIKTKKMLLLK